MVEDEFPIGCILKQVLVIEDQDFKGDELCLEQVLLFFDHKFIKLKPLADTDEIAIIFLSAHEMLEWDLLLKETPLRNNQPLGSTATQKLSLSLSRAYIPTWCNNFIGKKLQTVWVCSNAQDYQDQIIFTFDRLHPNIAFIAEGSTLKVFRQEQIHKEKVFTTNLKFKN